MSRRPILVWIISISYLLAAVVGISVIMLESVGIIPLNSSTQQYFNNLGTIGWIDGALSFVLAFGAAILLLMMRRIAVWLLVITLTIDIIEWTREVITQGYENVVVGVPISTVVVGWIIRLAIIFYCYRLAKKGVLT
jgi:hypothetical protein